ncbi:MAG: hypothetical protein GY861_24720, partial [bacterium]|nr:hypothetical protein [bacterium]
MYWHPSYPTPSSMKGCLVEEGVMEMKAIPLALAQWYPSKISSHNEYEHEDNDEEEEEQEDVVLDSVE